MQERTSLVDALEGIGKVERELDDNVEMIALGEAENDDGVVVEAENALKALKKEVARRELEALLSGEADKFDSYLEVHAGAGGTESQDWAAMLLRMYTRWAEEHGFKVEYLEETPGEEAGIKSATVQISGHNAYGWLKTEAGVHFKIGIEAVGLAREQRFQLAARDFLLQGLERVLGLDHHALVVLGFAERDHFDIVVELTLDLADAFERIHQRGALLHQLLGLLGIVPEIGIFGELVQLGEASRGCLDVKDASSAARQTA